MEAEGRGRSIPGAAPVPLVSPTQVRFQPARCGVNRVGDELTLDCSDSQTEAKRKAALLNDVDVDRCAYGEVDDPGGATPLSGPLLIPAPRKATQQRVSLGSRDRHRIPKSLTRLSLA